MFHKKIVKWILALTVISVLAIIYKTYNPDGNVYFPKCLFRELTGYKCPGCGSQRAVHYLLNLDLMNALKENALLVLAIPYLLLGFMFDAVAKPSQKMLKWRRILFGRKAIFIILTMIIAFWILRNLSGSI